MSEAKMTEHTPAELIARVQQLEARLERRDRRLKRGALLCVCVLTAAGLAAGLMAQTQTTKKKPATPAKKPAAAAAPAPAPAAPAGPTIIEAQGFLLKDANGQVRAELSLSGTEPTFKLRDSAGTALVTLSLNDGASGGPMLLLSSPQKSGSLTMSALEGAGAQVSLIGARPDIQLRLGVAPDRTSVELTDKDGFGATLGDNAFVAKNGKAKTATAASVVLFDKDRKTLWSAP